MHLIVRLMRFSVVLAVMLTGCEAHAVDWKELFDKTIDKTVERQEQRRPEVSEDLWFRIFKDYSEMDEEQLRLRTEDCEAYYVSVAQEQEEFCERWGYDLPKMSREEHLRWCIEHFDRDERTEQLCKRWQRCGETCSAWQ